MDGTATTAQLAFDVAQRTVTAKIGQKLRAVVKIHPDAELGGVVTNNFVPAQANPTHERIVSFDEPSVAQAQNRDVQRTGAKGGAKACFTLSQPCFALPQFFFGALAHGNIVANGLNKLTPSKLHRRQKDSELGFPCRQGAPRSNRNGHCL